MGAIISAGSLFIGAPMLPRDVLVRETLVEARSSFVVAMLIEFADNRGRSVSSFLREPIRPPPRRHGGGSGVSFEGTLTRSDSVSDTLSDALLLALLEMDAVSASALTGDTGGVAFFGWATWGGVCVGATVVGVGGLFISVIATRATCNLRKRLKRDAILFHHAYQPRLLAFAGVTTIGGAREPRSVSSFPLSAAIVEGP